MILDSAIWSNPFIAGVAGALIAAGPAYLLYLHTRKTDEAAKQAKQEEGKSASVQQVIDGLNRIIEREREDYDDLGKRMDKVSTELAACRALYEARGNTIIEMQTTIRDLEYALRMANRPNGPMKIANGK